MGTIDTSRLNGRRVVASVSGGKDSAAMSLALHAAGIEHDRVFCDTGWEHPWTYLYVLSADEARACILAIEQYDETATDEMIAKWLRQHGEAPLQRAIGPITRLAPKLGMQPLVRKKAMFPSRQRRFCTQELKVFPIAHHLAELMDNGVEDVINAVGIRSGESAARSKMAEWEWWGAADCDVWRPIIRWSEQDVIAIHREHGLSPNPLYLHGASRVGCWPCIYARKSEIRHIADTDPGRIDLIARLEARVTEAAAERYAKRGETFESLGYLPPSWFQQPTHRKEGEGACWPIAKVVEWSRTARGGRQFELFAPEREEGCVRWGLCETAAE